jgi:hypothetical protein
MKTKELVSLSVFMLLHLCANSQSANQEVIYTQKVTRDDAMFVHPVSTLVGFVSLTSDSLIFTCKKKGVSRFNFSLPYTQIKSIDTFYRFLIPNRIEILTKDGESYRLFTYKKRNIIRITRERMSNA